MLIKLSEAIQKYNLKITGVLQVGAHFGEEFMEYQRCGIHQIVFIEPCAKAFQVLKDKFGMISTVKLINSACGAKVFETEMFVETANNGQSNSILKPKLHLKQFPSIKFNGKEKVTVVPLDFMDIDRSKYNMLMMDVQGFELEVLKGAKETLKNIEVIYTEVNRAEVYELNARVEQLDEFLSDFERVETNWAGGNWGDAIYIKKEKSYSTDRNSDPAKRIFINEFPKFADIGQDGPVLTEPIDVPKEFQPHHPRNYPSDNHLIFEEWLSQNITQTASDRYYLPIFWTSYYCTHKYGEDPAAIKRLQDYLNSLDRSKKYYTIVQYDNGILNDISKLDIKVFGMSGKGADYNLPLLCQPHKYKPVNVPRDIFASYIGANTHPIRKEILKLNIKGCLFTSNHHNLDKFCWILARSVFTLAPRGYGANSFRIMEAISYYSVPVYVSDIFIYPYGIDFEEYGVVIRPEDIPRTEQILRAVDVKAKMEKLKQYRPLFSYEGCKEMILKNI